MHIVSIGVDSDELAALQQLIRLVAMTKESQELLLKATPLLANLSATYEEIEANLRDNTPVKKQRKKNEIESLKATIERQKWQISGLMVQGLLSQQRTFWGGQNNTAVVAAYVTDPEKVKLRCIYHGEFEVRPRNILAVESQGKLKKIYFKEPICPLRSDTRRLFMHVRMGFDALLSKLQKQVQFFFRVHDSYAVNLFEYRLLQPGRFVFRDDNLTSVEYKDIRRIDTDFKFNEANYKKARQETDSYEAHIAKFNDSKEQLVQIDKQMEYFNGKYGNKRGD